VCHPLSVSEVSGCRTVETTSSCRRPRSSRPVAARLDEAEDTITGGGMVDAGGVEGGAGAALLARAAWWRAARWRPRSLAVGPRWRGRQAGAGGCLGGTVGRGGWDWQGGS
jgi:hypothetical protein